MYSSALSIEIISDVEFSRRLVESRSDKLKQVKSNETTQLVSRNEITQLVSRNETTQLCTAVDRLQRLQPPTTACNRLQPPTTAYNRLQPPAPPLQQNRLFLPTSVEWLSRNPHCSGGMQSMALQCV
ncbi:hypothetical protein TNCV_124361 [Trichonephila clavipes]|nr:hypothetical protein TNCV_124361 [Trichonephila clavipes]